MLVQGEQAHTRRDLGANTCRQQSVILNTLNQSAQVCVFVMEAACIAVHAVADNHAARQSQGARGEMLTAT
jgi:hypothetical protein